MTELRSAGTALAVVGLVLLVTDCKALDADLCHPTVSAAATDITTAWCTRWTACDAKRGSVAACVADQRSRFYVDDADGCASSCADDTSTCKRSTCKSDRIEACKRAVSEMKCEEQDDGQLLRYADFCDSCFKG